MLVVSFGCAVLAQCTAEVQQSSTQFNRIRIGFRRVWAMSSSDFELLVLMCVVYGVMFGSNMFRMSIRHYVLCTCQKICGAFCDCARLRRHMSIIHDDACSLL